MTGKTIKILAAAVVVLALAVMILDRSDHSIPPSHGQVFLPEFARQANNAQQIAVVSKDSDAIALRRESGQWLVENRDEYPADISKLRQIIGALANAKIVEQKTEIPDFYSKLAVGDPQAGGSGTMITIDGDGFSYSVILGKQVQSDRRYARVAGTEQSYLIDQNPDIPKTIEGWLLPEILNIDAKRVRKITINHADGETVVIEKSSEDLTDFAVLDIPDGRELSYATVGNGIAGVLSKLDLEDVRAAIDVTTSSSAILHTWDGLLITAEISSDGESSWVSFSAEAAALVPPPGTEADVSDNLTTTDDDTAARNDEASQLNDRLSGWQFQISDYKVKLLTKHWNDILKPLTD